MLFKTRGIVLNFIKYSESSIIAKVYTEEFGIQSYIVNSIRSKNSKTKIALFQPLTLLDLVVYHKPSGGLQRISELKCLYPFKSIPFELHKSAVAIFIAEVLSKTLKEDYSNYPLFQYLFQTIATLDEATSTIENFHLKFLINLSSYLGFMPTCVNDILTTGYIKAASTLETEYIEMLLSQSDLALITTKNSTRRICMEYLAEFYSYHVENFGTLNSIKVLREVFSN